MLIISNFTTKYVVFYCRSGLSERFDTGSDHPAIEAIGLSIYFVSSGIYTTPVVSRALTRRPRSTIYHSSQGVAADQLEFETLGRKAQCHNRVFDRFVDVSAEDTVVSLLVPMG